MAFCAKCGAQMADGTTFCGSCGAVVGGGTAPSAPAGTASAGMTSNVAGALAYLTIIPAIIFLVVDPFKNDKFVKFHAFQSIFFGVGMIALWIGMMIIQVVLAFIPVIGWILSLLLWFVIGLGGFVLWILLTYKAYNNEKFMLPVIGKLAEQQASR